MIAANGIIGYINTQSTRGLLLEAVDLRHANPPLKASQPPEAVIELSRVYQCLEKWQKASLLRLLGVYNPSNSHRYYYPSSPSQSTLK